MPATTAAAGPAASALTLLTLTRRSRRGSVRGTFGGGRGSSRWWLRYGSAFSGGGTHAGNYGLFGGSLGRRAVGRRSVALLTRAAVAISAAVSSPVAVTIPHRPFVASDLVEIVVLFEEVRDV